MKVSQLFAVTRKENPSHTDIHSYGLLERAGYIRQLSSGIFNYLHLGLRSMQKIEQILREEMNRIGGVEINMPVVHPADVWRKTGRYDAIDESLVRFSDRTDRDLVLAMTHEEIVSLIANMEVTSYKQLPKLVYQLQMKFRDELRPRAGLIRVKEFIMKDSYSLDVDNEGLQKQYEAHYTAYYRMFARMGLPVVAILSDTGMMGGSMAHEYMYLTEIGEDTIFISQASGYKANKEIATFKKEFEPVGEVPAIEKVETPGVSTIADLGQFLGLPESKLGKMVFGWGKLAGAKEEEAYKLIACVVPGHLEMNENKLKVLLKLEEYRAATPEEISAAGGAPGYASPLGLDEKQTLVVVDDSIPQMGGLVMGANEQNYHLLNVQYGRDYEAQVIGDIVSAYEGAPCPLSGEPMDAVRGVEAGNIFQLGTKYSIGLDAMYMDVTGRPQPIVMGSYGIGVGRALACLAQHYNDDKGLKLPITVAPFHVSLILIPGGEGTQETGDQLYQDMLDAGVEVLYDDRGKKVAGPGAKFKDSELMGIPIRITVSKRSLANGGVEFKLRTGDDFEVVAVADVVGKIKETVAALFQEIADFTASQPTWESEQHLWKK